MLWFQTVHIYIPLCEYIYFYLISPGANSQKLEFRSTREVNRQSIHRWNQKILYFRKLSVAMKSECGDFCKLVAMATKSTKNLNLILNKKNTPMAWI